MLGQLGAYVTGVSANPTKEPVTRAKWSVVPNWVPTIETHPIVDGSSWWSSLQEKCWPTGKGKLGLEGSERPEEGIASAKQTRNTHELASGVRGRATGS